MAVAQGAPLCCTKNCIWKEGGAACRADTFCPAGVQLCTKRVLFVRVKECGLWVMLAVWMLSPCLAVWWQQVNYFFQPVAETWPCLSIQLWTSGTQIHLNFRHAKVHFMLCQSKYILIASCPLQYLQTRTAECFSFGIICNLKYVYIVAFILRYSEEKEMASHKRL